MSTTPPRMAPRLASRCSGTTAPPTLARRPNRPASGSGAGAAADEVANVADALGVGRFGVMGHSGGSVFALARGALLGERVLGVACVAVLAPFHAEGPDWFAGMAAGAARLRAATQGRAALEAFLASRRGPRAGPGGRSGRDGGRRAGLRRPMGVCSWAGPRAGAVGARWRRPDGEERGQDVGADVDEASGGAAHGNSVLPCRLTKRLARQTRC
jgi:pimeloyl-ACP methyl ester carboxylesterase